MTRIDKAEFRSGLPRYLYGLVVVEDARYDKTLANMEISFLYAERYKQCVRYEEVYYYDKALLQRGLYIGLAEELPMTALLESYFEKPLRRFYSAHGQPKKEIWERLASKGNKLFVHHGKAYDYIIIARQVVVKDII